MATESLPSVLLDEVVDTRSTQGVFARRERASLFSARNLGVQPWIDDNAIRWVWASRRLPIALNPGRILEDGDV